MTAHGFLFLCKIHIVFHHGHQVLTIVYHLVKFGYYADTTDIVRLLPCLLDLIEGTDDVPFPPTKGWCLRICRLAGDVVRR